MAFFLYNSNRGEMMNTNKKYKDSVFTRYFSDEHKLRLLYNALENTNYGEETEVNIITLEDVLFMNQKNDICFTIDKNQIKKGKQE